LWALARSVISVLSPFSAKVTTDSISKGQPAENGARTTPPSSSENEAMNTRRSGGTISR
jgi:hypothetical protein